MECEITTVTIIVVVPGITMAPTEDIRVRVLFVVGGPFAHSPTRVIISSMETTRRQVARAALLVMSAFAVSRALGFVRQIVFGLYFGTGPEMDAYVAALRVPDALFLVVAGGALGSAFIPTFSGRLAQGDEAGAWRLASAISNLLLTILVP
jgi:putative peptidoglycan lipid II flippase